METIPLIQAAVVVGVGVILPLALGRPLRWWLVAAGAAAIAAVLPAGPVAALGTLPWFALAGTEAIERARHVRRRGLRSLAGLADVVVPVFALVAAGAFAQARAGTVVVGPGDPIATLTAVHFTYAGAAALALALAARNRAVGVMRSVTTTAVVLTTAAPAVVALGFLTHGAVPQVGGALLMTAGVWSTAAAQLAEAWRGRSHAGPAALLGLSGAAVLVPMVLAVAWALGQHADVPALSVPDMVRTHGSANAVGFVLLGLVARRAPRPPNRRNACIAPSAGR